ncbi:MAG TPA: anti-sigma factor antagonist [Phycisphaeraceae bacterium]|nr:anti-sigma factor antagonist [Phycisphaeraceae bacterium]
MLPASHSPFDESADNIFTSEPGLATIDQMGQTIIATLTPTELSGTMATQLILDLFREIETRGGRHFVLDLQNVRYMDSACVGALVELLNKIQKRDGRIALVNAAQSVEYLFKLTRLDRVFPLCRDVMSALNAVERGHSG